ncbi:MAG: argininosuccinate synthase [Ekhidna sp.]|nr:argininosuccinate synthase [Ekhidna sp.]MBC6426518.1 argininosuccinate synthase [Ekhidna sp.]
MKVVLAFSGGLDTTYCAIYLAKELGYNVYAVTVNTGGFDNNERTQLEKKAVSLGVKEYHFLDVTEDFYQKGVKYLIFGNVLKNNTYPLSVSAERVFQAVAIAEYANKIGADAIAHGSTGAGNDQVRFDLVFQTLCREKKIITPIRDNQLSREEEIDFLRQNGVSGDWEKAKYSINQGLWGTSVGGKETLTSDQYLPEEAFPSQLQTTGSQTITIEFKKGEPIRLNGMRGNPVKVIQQLNKLGAKYAVGRDIHVGDTMIGTKGRVGFEAPAALMLIKAHHALEKHVLSKTQIKLKDQLAAWHGEMMHEGQYLDPAMRDVEAFLESSQTNVTGKVKIFLAPYRFYVEGIISPNDLMQPAFSQYGEMNNAWTGEDAKGFVKILANQGKILNTVHHD